jgi:hypothetical protein
MLLSLAADRLFAKQSSENASSDRSSHQWSRPEEPQLRQGMATDKPPVEDEGSPDL